MEQYEIPPGRYYQVLCDSLKYFQAENVFIRLAGSAGGTVKVNEDVREKTLSLKRRRNGLEIIIDGQTHFLFEQASQKKDEGTGKCWAVAFMRIDPNGRIHCASTGYPNHQEPGILGPDDLQLPEVRQTIFRAVNWNHLIEIAFAGKIPIRRTDRTVFSRNPSWYYWDIDYSRIPHYNKPRG